MSLIELKSRFPIFQKEKTLVYLDSAATSQKPKSVIDAVTKFYAEENATVHRGVYRLSEMATARYELVRAKVAQFINASDCCEIIFTSGTTDAINLVAHGWTMNNVGPGDEIVTTEVEHHANLLPMQMVAKEKGATLRFIGLDKSTFFLDVSNIDEVINEKTKFVAITHSSNVLGEVWRDGDLEKVIARTKAVGAKILIDGAQSVAHRKVDMQDLGADFFAFSAHKMLGPTGLGVLYIKKDLLDEVEPFRFGGSMVRSVSLKDFSYDVAPSKFEAGTPPIAQVIGLGAAIDFFNEHVDFDALCRYEAKLCEKMVDGMSRIDGVTIFGNQDEMKRNGHLVSFTLKNVHAHDVAALLGENDIAVRAGHHCAQPLVKSLIVEALVRVSLYMYNTEEDVDLFLKELDNATKVFL